jgi:hypothetical protein
METQNGTPASTGTRTAALRRSFLLYALVIATGLATKPFFNMGYNDDWEFSLIAARFAQTGHMMYGGWAAPALLVQTIYGALLTKVFGGTYVVHRLGTLFLAGFIPVLVYQTGRRLRLNDRMAFFAALTVGLSPLFAPHAVSFMSDAYGCLFAVAAIYAGIRSVQAEPGSTGVAWFGAGMLVAFLGGMNRQVVWVAGPAIFCAYCFPGRRQGRRQLLAGTVLMAAYALGCWCVLAWFNRQPWIQHESFDAATLRLIWTDIGNAIRLYRAFLLTCLVLAVPALAAGARAGLGHIRANTLGFATGLLLFVLGYGHNRFVFPLLPNVLTQYGLHGPGVFPLLPGDVPVVLPMWLCRLIPAFACGLATILVVNCASGLRRASRPILRAILTPNEEENTRIVSALLPCAFIVLYLLALAGRAARGQVYDRYALVLLPFVVIVILWLWQRAGNEKPGAGAYALLIAYSVYGVVITHDHFALKEAQGRALAALAAQGVPRGHILAGFEPDLAWLESERGFLPKAEGSPEQKQAGAVFYYLECLATFRPVYLVSTSSLPGLPSCRFEPTEYQTWLSPRHRELVVLCHEWHDVMKQ